MPNIFDEASKATEELFENPTPDEATEAGDDMDAVDDTAATEMDASATEVPAEDSDIPTEETQTQPTQEQAMLEDAVQTAEAAAQAAAEKDAQLQQIMQELEMAREQQANMQAAIEELSRQNEEHIVKEALEPPMLDISSLAFADEDTIREAQRQYAQQMADYNRQSFMKEFAPVIEQANKAKYDEEKNSVISVLSQIPELQGIETMMPQLDKIIKNNKVLSSNDIPIDEKYIMAYAMARGVNAINTPPEEPKELTADDLMKLYNENPTFQEMVEKQRIDQVKNSQQVPLFSASSGAVNAALDIKEEPKGWDDASERTRNMLR